MLKNKVYLTLAFFVFVISAAVLSLQAQKANAHDSRYKDTVSGMNFVLVKGGCFEMGDTFGDSYRNERPVHQICLDDYYISEYVVTQAQWQAVMGDNPTYFQICGANCPVVDVSWDDIQNFTRSLNNKTNRNYRFPTEAEWEYAARSGGKKEKWSGTSNVSELGDYAWFFDNSTDKLHPVGQKKPNALGIYDMTGNVREWVADWYDGGYYHKSPSKDPQGPVNGSVRVVRNGSFRHMSLLVRTSHRGGVPPNKRKHDIGFRLAE